MGQALKAACASRAYRKRQRQRHLAWQALLRKVSRLRACRKVGRRRVRACRVRCRRRANVASNRRRYWWLQGRTLRPPAPRPSASDPPPALPTGVPARGRVWWVSRLWVWVVSWVGDFLQDWNPFKAVRVGEASHPGPTAADASLAAALLSVLQAYQPKGADASKPSPATPFVPAAKGTGKDTAAKVSKTPGPSGGTGPGVSGGSASPQPRKKDTPLAQVLLNVLQIALREQWDDPRVAKSIGKKLKKYLPPPPPQPVSQTPTQPSDAAACVQGPVSAVGKGVPTAPTKGGGKGTGKHAVLANPSAATKGGRPDKPDSAQVGRGAIVDINPQEWERSALLTTKKAILGALREGKAPPGTVVAVASADDVLELRDAWKALSRYEPLTIILDQPGVETLQGTTVFKTRAGVRRAGSSWAVEDLRLFAIGDSNQAPFVKAARTTNVRQFTPPARQTVRLVAPARYRRVHLVDKDDSVVQVLAQVASASGLAVSALSGGQWAWNQVKSEWHLTGHLRLSPEAAAKVVAASGTKGVFAKLLKAAKQPDPPVYWFPRPDSDTDGNYYRTCLASAQSRKQYLCYRAGGGSDLGVLRCQDDPRHAGPVVLEAQGFTAAWDAEAVAEFFAAQNWTEVTVLTRRRKGKQRFAWILRATPPADEPLVHDRLQVWHYRDTEDAQLHVYVTRTAARQPSSQATVRAEAPRRSFKAQPVLKPTADVTMEAQTIQDDDDEDLLTPRSDSERKQRSLGPPAQGCEFQQVLSGGWARVDQGGNGDCGFRAMVAAMRFNADGVKLSAESSRTEGAILRTQLIDHLRRHRQDYGPTFARDRDVAPEAPTPDTNQEFDEWLTTMADPRAWADGLVLQAMARRHGVPVVVWYLHRQVWLRVCVAAQFSEGFAKLARKAKPVVLVLEAEHFQWLCPPDNAEVPKAWLAEGPLPKASVLRGGGPKSSGTPSLHSLESRAHGRLSAAGTPSLHSLGAPTKAASSERPTTRPPKVGSTEAPTEVNTDGGGARAHVIRHKRKWQNQQATEGRSLWWSCDVAGCGFRVFRHPSLKNHAYHRKSHLNHAHGVPWNEIPPFKPEMPEEPKPPPFNGKSLFMKERWEHAWRLFHDAKWPGAHVVPCEPDASSKHGNPYHKCNRCKELIRRSQLPALRCPKARNTSPGPSEKRRAQLWKGWLKQASVAATASCKEAKRKRKGRDEIPATSCLRRQSAAQFLSAAQVQSKNSCGLPAFPAVPVVSGQVWWRCPVPTCDFVVKHGEASMSSKRKNHLIRTHGQESYEPLPKGHLQAVARRLPESQKTFQERWEHKHLLYSKSEWQGMHKVSVEPEGYRQYASKLGHTYVKPYHKCSVCHLLVSRDQLPVERCPAAKVTAVPALKVRKKHWAAWSAEAKKKAKDSSRKRRGKPALQS